MRILTWHVHGSWTTSFVAGRHDYLLPLTADRDADGRGRARTWTWPATAVEHTPQQLAEQVRAGGVDVVVLQRPHEIDLLERWTGARAGRDLPAVYVEHNAPTGHAASTRHPMADVDVVADGTVPLVHVTAFNALMWDNGTARTVVIDHGIPDPGHLYTGERSTVAAVVNEPVRRWRVAGTDVLLHMGREAALDVYGMGVDGLRAHLDATGGLGSDATLHGDVPQHAMHARLGQARVYLHPFRWTSLGLALLEAMAVGLPVVALATTETPEAVPAAAGVVSNRPQDLVAAAHRWIADPDEARARGDAARAHVLTRYPLAEFLLRWDTLLQEVTP
ncbi:glycosyltransferase [Sanguibacter suarezii]|uniref:glycosyltransferase n=1 Tax=Sanguibacter suarezii TaxID=60921 RepID=UPI000834D27A|nr:glycosyltransferase [Sanguibacter suarezii]